MKKVMVSQESIFTMRERLQKQATELASRLSRSVTRAASVDLVACTEYREEVKREYELIDELLYIQNCRSTLERAIDRGYAKLVWRWTSGRVTTASFKREHNQIRMRMEETPRQRSESA